MAKSDLEFIKKDKIVQHTVNGISRFLILWIIKSSGPIHGYGVMKELDSFFDSLIKTRTLKKSIPSKIYNILKNMEENDLISSVEIIRDNKKVKFYSLTDKGEFLLKYIKDSYIALRKTNKGSKFFNDFLNVDWLFKWIWSIFLKFSNPDSTLFLYMMRKIIILQLFLWINFMENYYGKKR